MSPLRECLGWLLQWLLVGAIGLGISYYFKPDEPLQWRTDPDLKLKHFEPVIGE